MTNTTLLAVAVASNGVMLPRDMLAREMLLARMADYFRTTPFESSQFDSATVLSELQEASDDDVAGLLTDIGFRATPATPDMFTIDSSLWEKFIADHSR